MELIRDKHGRYQTPCCGTCLYHQHEDIDDGWVCACSWSRFVAEWTEYDFVCEDWEER